MERGGSKGLRVVARAGDPAVGAGRDAVFSLNNRDVVFDDISLHYVRLSDDGYTSFRSRIENTPGFTFRNDFGVWTASPAGELTLVMQTGEPTGLNAAESLFGAQSWLATKPEPLAGGSVIFKAGTTDSDHIVLSGEGIWAGSSQANRVPVAELGSQAPGLSEEAVFTAFGQPTSTPEGGLLVLARYSGPGTRPWEHQGVWFRDGDENELTLVALLNEQASGIAAGTTIRSFDSTDLGGGDRLLLQATLDSGAPTSTPEQAIWKWDRSGGLQLIASTLAVSQGDISGFSGPRFTYFASRGFQNGSGEISHLGSSSINWVGDTAFVAAYLTDDEARHVGVWSDAGREEHALIASTSGSAAVPGSIPTARFESFFAMDLNDDGRVAFVADLAGDGIDATNDRGIWAQDPRGVLTKIVQTGDTIDLSIDPATQDLRVLSGVSIATREGASTDTPPWFNDWGEVAFLATFTDGTEAILVGGDTGRVVGDFDGDLSVTTSDVQAWIAQYGRSVPPGVGADSNRDGVVDSADYTLWRDAMTGREIQPDPEPSPLLSLLLGCAGLFCVVRPWSLHFQDAECDG